MNEPAPPIGPMLLAFAAMSVGVYVLLAALALEVYALVPVALVCFAAAFAPALKLVRRQS